MSGGTRTRLARLGLSEGTVAVGLSIGVLGVTSYGFLVISGRILGPERYAPLAALWTLVFLGGTGFFLPFEQEVARAFASRRGLGLGAGAVLRRATAIAAGLALALTVALVAARGVVLDEVLGGKSLLLLSLVGALGAYGFEFVVRGALAGSNQFTPYAVLLGTEGTVRFAGAAVLGLAGVRTAGPYGLTLALAPLVATVVAARGQSRLLADRGPVAPWREVAPAIGYLLVTSVLSQVLVNAAPLALTAIADPSESAVVGQFLACLVIARIPLFLFGAVQAALLPSLAALAGTSIGGFVRHLRRTFLALTAFGLFSTVVALTVGPFAVRVLFGAEFALTARDLGLLAAGNIVYILAVVLSQALVALSLHRRAAYGWVAGIAVFAVVTAAVEPLVLRVEVGFLAGAAAALAVFAAVTAASVRRVDRAPTAEDLAEAVHAPLEP